MTTEPDSNPHRRPFDTFAREDLDRSLIDDITGALYGLTRAKQYLGDHDLSDYIHSMEHIVRGYVQQGLLKPEILTELGIPEEGEVSPGIDFSAFKSI